MPQRTISDDFFVDPFIVDLDPSGKLLFFYLITNCNNKIAGFYKISEKIISHETDIKPSKVKSLLKDFQDKGKVTFDNGYIFVHSMVRNQKCAKLPYGKKHINNTIEQNSNQINNSAYQAFLKEMNRLNLLNEEYKKYIVAPTLGEGLPNPLLRDNKINYK